MTPSTRPSLPQPLPASLPYNDLNGREATEILVDWFRQLLRGHYLLQPHLTLPMAVLDLQVHIGVDMYVGGTVPVSSPPDHIDINGSAIITNNIPGAERGAVQHMEHDFAATVNAAPVPGGLPPDQVREQHGLPVPRPGYGSRNTGSHLFLADIPNVDADIAAEAKRVFTAAPQPDSTGGRRGDVAEGYVFSSEVVNVTGTHQSIEAGGGSVEIETSGRVIHHESGMSTARGRGGKAAVSGVYDLGPAGIGCRSTPAGMGGDGRPRLSFGNSHRGS